MPPSSKKQLREKILHNQRHSELKKREMEQPDVIIRSNSNQSKLSHLSRASALSRLTAKSGLSNPDEILKRL